MRVFAHGMSIVMMMMMIMLCLDIAVGQEQKNRPLSYEQHLSTTTKQENDHAEPLVLNYHDDITTTNNNNNNNEEEEDEEETSRRLQYIDLMSFYFSADIEMRFYNRWGPKCFERYHDHIVPILMDGLDEVVGRSEFAGRAIMVNHDTPICSEDDGTRRKTLRMSGNDSSSSATTATTATTTTTGNENEEEEESEDERNLQLRASYFLHNFHSGAYKCRLCNSDTRDVRDETAVPTPAPLSREQRLDALSVDASAHITSALQLSRIRCLSQGRTSVRVTLSMVSQTNVGSNGCEQ